MCWVNLLLFLSTVATSDGVNDVISISPTADVLVNETNKVWINIASMYQFLGDGSMLWSSEQSGFRHLYLFRRRGGSLDDDLAERKDPVSEEVCVLRSVWLHICVGLRSCVLQCSTSSISPSPGSAMRAGGAFHPLS